MQSAKKKVVLGFLGTALDSGKSDKRWERWRPTVAMFMHEHFRPDALELFVCKEAHLELATQVSSDILSLAPDTEINGHLLDAADPWNFQQVYAALFDFAKSYNFKDDTDYYVHLTTGTHVAQICMFLLAESRHFPAKILETFAHGAPAEHNARGTLEVIDLNLAAYDQLAQRFSTEREDSQALLKGGVPTLNAKFNALIERVEKVALRSTAPMLFTGPTGAGKSQLAARVYALRAARHLVKGALVEVNCATLRGDNAMSALFGHKKGAFTGAVADRPGLLKAADNGVLFLDEVGELGPDEQAMLLRALEDKRFMPLGSEKEVHSNFQLLAGTNKDLQAEVAAGRFRADLLARINVWTFQLPGLAQRSEDIEPNLDFELERIGKELGVRLRMDAAARTTFLEAAKSMPWPGNFRDFSAVLTRLATLAEGGRIDAAAVQLELGELQSREGEDSPVKALPGAPLRAHRLLEVVLGKQAQQLDMPDAAYLECVLAVLADSDSLAQAGRTLFAKSRQTKETGNDSDRLRKYLLKNGLDYKQVKAKLALFS